MLPGNNIYVNLKMFILYGRIILFIYLFIFIIIFNNLSAVGKDCVKFYRIAPKDMRILQSNNLENHNFTSHCWLRQPEDGLVTLHYITLFIYKRKKIKTVIFNVKFFFFKF